MPWERLADLDELILRCRTDAAKEYIREAVASYRAGAYRAAIVTTWIAITYDIIDKSRELSLTRDTQATDFIQRFENIQDAYQRGDPDALERSQKFERELLSEAAGKFELLSANERLDLERLRADRHRCAHPSMNTPEEPYRPTAEQARLHLRNAIVHVLQQSPAQGKTAFALLERELASEYFPSEPDQAKIVLAAGPLARPRRNLVDRTVRHCVDAVVDSSRKAPERDRYIAALNALIDMHPEAGRELLGKKLNALLRGADPVQARLALGLVARVSGCWMLLDSGAQTKFCTMVQNDSELPEQRYFPDLHRIDDLKVLVEERISKLDLDQLGDVIKHGGGRLCVERAKDLFCEAMSWSWANNVADNVILPLVEYLQTEQIMEIIKSPSEKSSDLIGSGGMFRFVAALRMRNDIDQDWLDGQLKAGGFGYLVTVDEVHDEEH